MRHYDIYIVCDTPYTDEKCRVLEQHLNALVAQLRTDPQALELARISLIKAPPEPGSLFETPLGSLSSEFRIETESSSIGAGLLDAAKTMALRSQHLKESKQLHGIVIALTDARSGFLLREGIAAIRAIRGIDFYAVPMSDNVNLKNFESLAIGALVEKIDWAYINSHMFDYVEEPVTNGED